MMLLFLLIRIQQAEDHSKEETWLLVKSFAWNGLYEWIMQLTSGVNLAERGEIGEFW